MVGSCESKEAVRPPVALKEAGSASKRAQATSPQASATGVPGAGGGKASFDAEQDNWNRMKECAAQADRVASRARLDSDKAVIGLQNHYSPVYRRCYMEITRLNSEARKNSDLPRIYYELWDAFEEKSLSICTDGPTSGSGMFCNIEEGAGFVNCDICRSFVKDRMTK